MIARIGTSGQSATRSGRYILFLNSDGNLRNAIWPWVRGRASVVCSIAGGTFWISMIEARRNRGREVGVMVFVRDMKRKEGEYSKVGDAGLALAMWASAEVNINKLFHDHA